MNTNLFKSVMLFGIMMAACALLYGQDTGEEKVQTDPQRRGLIDRSKRFTTVLAGVAIAEDQPGFHIEMARGYQPSGFGIGAFTSFVRIPAVDFSDWTIVGLQLRAGPQRGKAKPYFVFDYGIINMVFKEDKVNMRSATVDLGGGLEIKMQGSSAFLLDFRWKRFLDYKAERDAFTVWTINAGLKF